MNHIKVGKDGENIAEYFLTRRNYTILERNKQIGNLEIDLILSKNDVLIFVEVKTRSTDLFSQPTDSINNKKLDNIRNAAAIYADQIQYNGRIRYDIVSVVLYEFGHKISHHPDAFFMF